MPIKMERILSFYTFDAPSISVHEYTDFKKV
jgi:hypothetical protein